MNEDLLLVAPVSPSSRGFNDVPSGLADVRRCEARILGALRDHALSEAHCTTASAERLPARQLGAGCCGSIRWDVGERKYEPVVPARGDMDEDVYKGNTLTAVHCLLRVEGGMSACPNPAIDPDIPPWRSDAGVAFPQFIAVANDIGGLARALGTNLAITSSAAASHEVGHEYGLMHAGYVKRPGGPLEWQDVARFAPVGSGLLNSRFVDLSDESIVLNKAGQLNLEDSFLTVLGEGPYRHPSSPEAATDDGGGAANFDTMSYADNLPGFSVASWNYLVSAMMHYRVCDPVRVSSGVCIPQVRRWAVGDPALDALSAGGM